MSNIILRKQSTILDDIRRRVRDHGKTLWTDQDVYMVVGDSLMEWSGRVSIPHVYTITGGWVAGQTDYDLPSYITGDVFPQQRRWAWTGGSENETNNRWVNVLGYKVWPNASGGTTLHLESAPAAGEGRIIWYSRNGRVPLVLPTLTNSITYSATSCELTTSEDVPSSGYIKIGDEWIGYAGITRGATSITISNLARALYGTTATSHTAGDTVDFGIAVHRDDLFTQLYNSVRAGLHSLLNVSAAESERAHHERQTMYYRDQADMFWRGYVPAKPWEIRLSHRAIGTVETRNIFQVDL